MTKESALAAVRDDQTAADLRARGGLKWTYFDEDVLGAWVTEMDSYSRIAEPVGS